MGGINSQGVAATMAQLVRGAVPASELARRWTGSSRRLTGAAPVRRESAPPAPQPGARLWSRLKRSPWLLIFLCCAVLIVLGYADYSSGGLVLRYADGRSKLNMARRMWDNLDPGFGQI